MRSPEAAGAWRHGGGPSHASQSVVAMEISALLSLCGRWIGGGNWASTLLSFLRRLAPGPPLILQVYQLWEERPSPWSLSSRVEDLRAVVSGWPD
jgi:hypothetical protein